MGEVLGSSVTPSSPPVPMVPPIRVLSTGGSFLYPGGGLAGALCLGLNRYVLGLLSSLYCPCMMYIDSPHPMTFLFWEGQTSYMYHVTSQML